MPKKLPLEVRFWQKVDRRTPDECWPWLAGHSSGYGCFKLGGKAVPAHRVAYQLIYGSIPQSIGQYKSCVCHSCDNPNCVNPNHLILGTMADNTADRDARGRAATGSRNGRHTQPETTARGEQHGRSKLTATQVRLIRSLYAQGNTTHRQLGDQFGVSHTQIRYIVSRKSWAHLD